MNRVRCSVLGVAVLALVGCGGGGGAATETAAPLAAAAPSATLAPSSLPATPLPTVDAGALLTSAIQDTVLRCTIGDAQAFVACVQPFATEVARLPGSYQLSRVLSDLSALSGDLPCRVLGACRFTTDASSFLADLRELALGQVDFKTAGRLDSLALDMRSLEQLATSLNSVAATCVGVADASSAEVCANATSGISLNLPPRSLHQATLTVIVDGSGVSACLQSPPSPLCNDRISIQIQVGQMISDLDVLLRIVGIATV